jgi:hypothetical protein
VDKKRQFNPIAGPTEKFIVRLRAIEPHEDFSEPKTVPHEPKCQHKSWEYALRRNELRFYDPRQKIDSLAVNAQEKFAMRIQLQDAFICAAR